MPIGCHIAPRLNLHFILFTLQLTFSSTLFITSVHAKKFLTDCCDSSVFRVPWSETTTSSGHPCALVTYDEAKTDFYAKGYTDYCGKPVTLQDWVVCRYCPARCAYMIPWDSLVSTNGIVDTQHEFCYTWCNEADLIPDDWETKVSIATEPSVPCDDASWNTLQLNFEHMTLCPKAVHDFHGFNPLTYDYMTGVISDPPTTWRYCPDGNVQGTEEATAETTPRAEPTPPDPNDEAKSQTNVNQENDASNVIAGAFGGMAALGGVFGGVEPDDVFDLIRKLSRAHRDSDLDEEVDDDRDQTGSNDGSV